MYKNAFTLFFWNIFCTLLPQTCLTFLQLHTTGSTPVLFFSGGSMTLPSLKIGDLTATMPVVQGGMGVGISLSGLASAVANEGGIGVIAGAMIGLLD